MLQRAHPVGVVDAAVLRLRAHHDLEQLVVLRGAPCAHPKATAAGHEERVDALAAHFEPASFAVAVHAQLRGARPDDVLDALAAAWTARRIARGEAVVLGDPDQRDARGMRCTIVA